MPMKWWVAIILPGQSLSEASGAPCYRIAAFCGVTAETPIDAPDITLYDGSALVWGSEPGGSVLINRGNSSRNSRLILKR